MDVLLSHIMMMERWSIQHHHSTPFLRKESNADKDNTNYTTRSDAATTRVHSPVLHGEIEEVV